MMSLRDLDTVLNDLQFVMKNRLALQQQLVELPNQGLSSAMADEMRAQLMRDVQNAWERCREQLRAALAFPPKHVRHAEFLPAFWNGAPYEKSVFIMTKFPEKGPGAAPKDAQLERVLNAVASAVKREGFEPRIATGAAFHAQLWDDVELHMLGCARGIAIVEDKYLPELNPNVAMEWGWMRGMARPVLFLVEESFTKLRADFSGLIKQRFSWADPEPGIDQAVKDFLQPR